jgi:hypothetical protein
MNALQHNDMLLDAFLANDKAPMLFRTTSSAQQAHLVPLAFEELRGC